MAQFTTLNLTGERVLVAGTDSQGTTNQVVVSSSEWTEVKGHQSFNEATASFEEHVEKFFAPLTEAADKLDLAFAKPADDPISYVVLNEGTEAEVGKEEVVIKLSHDSVVLRLIEASDFDRLVWVGDDLEVLEVLSVNAN